MINDIYGYHKGKQIICDNCGVGFEAESWENAKSRMDEEGWKTKKLNGKWVQLCSACAKEG